jgi:hypothetical protein
LEARSNRFPLQRSRLDTGRISWFTSGRLHQVAPDKEAGKSRILLGIICSLVFGAIDIGIMLSMSFPGMGALGGLIIGVIIGRFGQ